jgi:two-component system, OmpR family, sensor histidine kinase QseC
MINSTSIKKRLTLGVIFVLLIAWLIGVVLVYRGSTHEVAEVYDASLASYARVLAALMAHEAEEEQDIQEKLQRIVEELGMETVQSSRILSEAVDKYTDPGQISDYLTLEPANVNHDAHPYESKIAFLIKAADGRILLRSSSQIPFDQIVNGFHTINSENTQWRVFGLTEKKNSIAVMVGEKIEIRTELLEVILGNVLWPFFLILPLIALILIGVINKGLKPLQIVAKRVSTRSHLSLEPLSIEATPVEILPLVDEINHLFNRIEKALENERRFTANAAHELRTPLAAIKTQVQVLQMNSTPELEPGIDHILSSVDRMTHLVEQLLVLARTEARSHTGIEFRQVNLAALVSRIMKDMSNEAFNKNLTLAFENHTTGEMVQGDETLLQIVIQNIIDNAIRYTPENGSVKVTLEIISDKPVLSVKDSGPGIPVEQQEQMFQRFQRGTDQGQKGVGLGLYIVRQITRLLNIDIKLETASSGQGLVFKLSFNEKSIRP